MFSLENTFSDDGESAGCFIYSDCLGVGLTGLACTSRARAFISPEEHLPTRSLGEISCSPRVTFSHSLMTSGEIGTCQL